MKFNLNKFSFLFVFIAASLWGIIGIFIRQFNKLGFNSMQIIFVRALFTILILFPIIFFYKRSLLKIKLKDIWCFLGTGVLSIVLFTFFYFTTITVSSLSLAAVLMYTAPFFMIFFAAVLFKEKITVLKIFACVIAFLGCMFVSGIFNSGNFSLYALITGVLSGIFYALYTVFSRYALLKGYNTITITIYSFIFALFGCLPFINIKQTLTVTFFSFNNILTAVFIAFFCTILPYLLYTFGLKNTQTGVALITASVEPVVATIIGFIFFNEIPSINSIIGIVLVLTSVCILNLKNH
ncbi:MAG: EamA family transporter [Clostridia bacterium]|nr:EamA family transporter [Clostridia bacterium]